MDSCRGNAECGDFSEYIGVYIYVYPWTDEHNNCSSDLDVEFHMAAKTSLHEPCSWVVMCDIS